MGNDTQHNVTIASIEHDTDPEKSKLKRDLELQKEDNKNLKLQVAELQRKLRASRNFHEHVKVIMSKEQCEVAKDLLGTTQTLLDRLEIKNNDYMETILIEERLEEEEETNRQMLRQLETANRDNVLLSEQHERDEVRIRDLNERLEATNHRPETLHITKVWIALPKLASEQVSDTKLSTTESEIGNGNGQQNTQSQNDCATEQSKYSITILHEPESEGLEVRTPDHIEISWKVLRRILADEDKDDMAVVQELRAFTGLNGSRD